MFRSQAAYVLLFLIAVGWLVAGTIAGSRQRQAMANMAGATVILRNHMEADMGHDAIRGEVMSILAASSGKGIDRQEATTSLRERIDEFRKHMEMTTAFAASRDVHDRAAALKGDVEAYLNAAAAIGQSASRDKAPSSDELATFIAKFEKLETGMSRVSDAVENYSARTKAEADHAGNVVALVTYSCFAVIAAIIGIIALVTHKGLLGPIMRIRNDVDQLARHDFSIEIGHTNRTDELGALATALCALRDQLATDAAKNAKESSIIQAFAGALSKLAKGNLSERVDFAMEGAFAGLKDDFNFAVSQLASTLGLVSRSSNAMLHSAREIGESSADLAQRNEEQAASLEAIADSISDVTGKVSASAEAIGSAQNAVRDANQKLEQGGAVIRDAVDAMDRIESSAQEIDSIISVIDGIAFQTSLLALNAGVEAARAGEAGKGFAVVASEVRALAQRSASAASEIKQLIRNSSLQVESGVGLVRSAGECLKLITDKVGEIDRLMEDVTASASDQARALTSIDNSAKSMERITQANAALSEEVTAATREVIRATDEVSRQLAIFAVEENSETTRPIRENADYWQNAA